MRKLTFERAVLMVLILIILISTSDITGRYIDRIKKYFNKPAVSSSYTGKITGFPTMLATADDLFKQGDYEGAADQYLKYSLSGTLTQEQKIHVNFRLGVCQFYMKKYELARDTFIKATSINSNDSIAYNNAAVSAYRANDIKTAIELEKKALELRPTVEYYYNLARMYEEDEAYELSLENYQIVAIGEQNITELQRIDPVRVKEKIARLSTKQQMNIDDKINKGLFVYRISDVRELFTVDENEMKLKGSDFEINIENQKDAKNILASYNKKNNDPYNLITDLVWTVYKNGKEFYKKSADKINFKVSDRGNYEIKLSIQYSGNQKLVSSKNVKINENISTIDTGTKEEVLVKPPVIQEESKTYPFSVYEQTFESDFKISSGGFTDSYNVVWGTDSGIETFFTKKLAIDKVSSLVVTNNNDTEGGIWINLDSLLQDNRIKGKSINISLFAREIIDHSDISISVRMKANGLFATTDKSFELQYPFEQKSIRVYVPSDASGFTVSIKTTGHGQFGIDGFTVFD